jgi:hypothetical protein
MKFAMAAPLGSSKRPLNVTLAAGINTRSNVVAAVTLNPSSVCGKKTLAAGGTTSTS